MKKIIDPQDCYYTAEELSKMLDVPNGLIAYAIKNELLDGVYSGDLCLATERDAKWWWLANQIRYATQPISDRITERTKITIVTASGEDVDAIQGREDALAGKPCLRTLPSYVNAYNIAAQRGIGTEKI